MRMHRSFFSLVPTESFRFHERRYIFRINTRIILTDVLIGRLSERFSGAYNFSIKDTYVCTLAWIIFKLFRGNIYHIEKIVSQACLIEYLSSYCFKLSEDTRKRQ